MAFVRKGAPSAKSLNDPEGVAQASQNKAGNTGYNINDPDLCYSSGVNPVDSNGRVTNKSGQVMNWPYQKFTVDNELNPRSNRALPGSPLSETPQTYGDFKSGDAGRAPIGNARQTLG